MTYPARLSFQARWALTIGDYRGNPTHRSAREGDVVRELVAMLAIAGEYFTEVEGAGLLLVGLQLYGLQDAKSEFATHRKALPFPDVPGAADGVSSDARVSAAGLRDTPEATARQLMERWLPSFYEDPEDLFQRIVPG